MSGMKANEKIVKKKNKKQLDRGEEKKTPKKVAQHTERMKMLHDSIQTHVNRIFPCEWRGEWCAGAGVCFFSQFSRLRTDDRPDR